MSLRNALPRLLLLCCAASFPAGAQQPARTPKVLLIGIDGIRVDILRQASTPAIDALAAAGAFTDRARTRPNTVSGPGWSSTLTGVWMEKHGVLDNDFTPNRYDLYPDLLTRLEQLRPELRTLAVLNWPPLANTHDGGPLVSEEVDLKVDINGDTLGYDTADELASRTAAHLLREAELDAAFVYLGDTDVVAHDTSSLSLEYRRAIETADRRIGMLVDAVKGRATYGQEDWLILVNTEHGRTDDGGHGGTSEEELTIFYLASGGGAGPQHLLEQTWIVDIAVTALAHLGIDADPAWDLDGRVNGIPGAR